MRHLGLFSLVSLSVLAACAQPQEINQPPVMYQTTKALNERGNTTLTVRAVNKTDGSKKELVGVACVFEGDGFKASFSTPAVVIAPEMHTRTPPASVTCTHNGVPKTKVLTPYNRTVSEINSQAMQIGSGGGVVGVLIGGTMATIQNVKRDAAQDIWAYPNAEIEF
ncbi:MAG: hypothetical protein ACRBCL_03660 [Maritimibacter sp.]